MCDNNLVVDLRGTLVPVLDFEMTSFDFYVEPSVISVL